MNLRTLIIAAVAGLAAAAGASSTAQPSARGSARAPVAEPVVVELFTAQGCAGCPAANRTLEALAAEPGVIVLTYAVDYWDYLGWPDTFARPAFAERQRDYQEKLRLRNVYTPQVIVDGRRQVSGTQQPEVQAAVEAEAARRIWPPEIEFRDSGDGVGIGSGRAPEGGASVWLVTYKPGPQAVEVTRGDNRGETVHHVNVVRSIRRLGDWSGQPVFLSLPDDRGEDEAFAVLVQSRDDGRILAAATS